MVVERMDEQIEVQFDGTDTRTISMTDKRPQESRTELHRLLRGGSLDRLLRGAALNHRACFGWTPTRSVSELRRLRFGWTPTRSASECSSLAFRLGHQPEA